MTKRLNIGISYNHSIGGSAADSIKSTFLDLEATLIDLDYELLVPRGLPLADIFTDPAVKSSIFATAKQRAEHMLQSRNIDGLIIPGNGKKINPRLYGGNKAPEIEISTARSIAEMALVHVAIQRGIPLLGICGGHQLISVYLGGTLKDIGDEDLEVQGAYCYGMIGFNPQSELAKICFDNLESDSIIPFLFFGAHNQTIDRILPPDLSGQKPLIRCVAIANDPSRSIEAFEAQFGAPIYCTQFHPEVSLKGMYSVVARKVSYLPEHAGAAAVSLRIFKAFEQAASTYQLKGKVILQMEQIVRIKESITTKFPKQTENKPTGRGIHPFEFFREASASLDNQGGQLGYSQSRY